MEELIEENKRLLLLVAELQDQLAVERIKYANLMDSAVTLLTTR